MELPFYTGETGNKQEKQIGSFYLVNKLMTNK